MKELVKKLSDMRGVSGFEYNFSNNIQKLMEPYADECFIDCLGNVVALKKCGNPNAKKLMLEGHIDEIGLMVSAIDKNGFISFVQVGGIDGRILPSSEVVIHGTRDINGIIGSKPPHLQTAEESKEPMKVTDLAIDTGYTYEEISKIVSIGDGVTFKQSVGEMCGDTISYKSLDDRAGIAVIIDVLRRINNMDLAVDVYVVATVQEEVGLRGAKTAAHLINPHMCISIDVCHGITPDNSTDAFCCGEGVVISKGPNIHPALSKKLIELADKNSIPFDIDVDGGNTGTNAWAVQIVREGIATALLSLPLKYMHNPIETMSIKDLDAAADLIVRFVESIDENVEDWLCF